MSGIDLNSLGIVFPEKPFCEHCGLLVPFEPVFNDGHTDWCLDCCYANDEKWLTDEIAKRAWDKGDKMMALRFRSSLPI